MVQSEDTDDQPDFDVQHIGALLAATPPQAGPLGTGRGRQRNRGPPQAPGAENGPSPCAPHKDQSRVPEDRRPAKRLCRHPECTAGASGPACGSCAGPSSSSEAGAVGGSGDPGPSGTARSHDYNRPKATANPKVVALVALLGHVAHQKPAWLLAEVTLLGNVAQLKTCVAIGRIAQQLGCRRDRQESVPLLLLAVRARVCLCVKLELDISTRCCGSGRQNRSLHCCDPQGAAMFCVVFAVH